MGLFEDEQPSDVSEKIDTNFSTVMEVNKMGGEKSIVRLEIGQYEYIEVDIANTDLDVAKRQIDDAVALQSYKNGARTTAKPVESAPVMAGDVPDKPAPAQGDRPSFMKIEFDVEHTVKVLSVDKPIDGKYGPTPAFTVEEGGVTYKLTTQAKALVAALQTKEEVTFVKFRNSENQTRYKVS